MTVPKLLLLLEVSRSGVPRKTTSAVLQIPEDITNGADDKWNIALVFVDST